MADDFKYDVFLSHSSKDKAIVRDLAERLRADGLRVWFDSWILKIGDSIPAKIEEGLEHSRILVLFMSANAFGSDWARLESQTFRFRDPLNKERRFIPVRLDNAPIKGSLGQFLYIDWLQEERDQEYKKLLEACRPPRLSIPDKQASTVTNQPLSDKQLPFIPEMKVLHGHSGQIESVAITPDGLYVISGSNDNTVRVWETTSGQCAAVLQGHESRVLGVAVNNNGRRIISGSYDTTVRVWEGESKQFVSTTLRGHEQAVTRVAITPDGQRAISGSWDGTVRVWDLETNESLAVLQGHKGWVNGVALSDSGLVAISGAADGHLIIWDLKTFKVIRKLRARGFNAYIHGVGITPDGLKAVSGDTNGVVCIWDIKEKKLISFIEGPTVVHGVAITKDGKRVVSAGEDGSLNIWDVETGQFIASLLGHTSPVWGVAITPDGRMMASGAYDNTVRIWELPTRIEPSKAQEQEFNKYTNAKVLLVGESGAGKTGLSKRLASNDWQPSDSTVGAWASQWKLPVNSEDGIHREIWLWDFGGQADQRLIHQLYMDETALAVLVFDGQKEDLLETLSQWDRDLSRASERPFNKLLVAGRVDAGGLRISRSQLEVFRERHGYLQLLETSAKTNFGCEELKQAILNGIDWKNIPWHSSTVLFKQLKEEIILLKDEGKVLMRFNELREILQLSLLSRKNDKPIRFNDEELKAVVRLLTGPGVVWQLQFGSWILLQPERINAYAQAVIQTLRQDEHERGCLLEERVLNGELSYHSSLARLEPDEERFVLLAMHQMLVKRGLCLREHTDRGPMLIFPSYYRRERPELIGHPAVLVSYRFNGFLDDIYATLVVRLHHTRPIKHAQLWRYAADFQTLTGKQLGIKLIRRAEGAGELEVYFDPSISIEEKIIFSKYVHEHLLQNAKDVVRLRHYICPHCGTPVGNKDVAMKKLSEGKKDIPCVNCDDPTKRIPLWDELEEMFAKPDMKEEVRKLQNQSDFVLDNESKERALVGEVISTVALAGQISREFNVSDHGIDMEIEFKADSGEATGRKLYLQLKSGDSYLRQRKNDSAEVFAIKDERNVRYWMEQAFPVLLVIRNSEGEVRWMEVSDWLKRESNNGQKPIKQIVFDGERFDVMSVRRWRDRILHL